MSPSTGSSTPHTSWCLRGHHCGMGGEHRGQPVAIPGEVGAVVTLVRRDGRTYAEIRASIRLPEGTEAEQTRALWYLARGIARLRADLRRLMSSPRTAQPALRTATPRTATTTTTGVAVTAPARPPIAAPATGALARRPPAGTAAQAPTEGRTS